MTNQDRRTLAEMLSAQARALRAAGAVEAARGLKRRAAKVLDGMYCALDISAASQPQPIPIRVRNRR